MSIKFEEHYGISLPVSGIRRITLEHARKVKDIRDNELGTAEAPGKDYVISETDGSIVPIVEPSSDGAVDKRKALFYREARLTLAHERGSRTPVISGTLGDVKETGRHALHCVKRVGADGHTKVHCVGDGAQWIANQMEEQKALLKASQAPEVLNVLKPHLESHDIADEDAPVRACYRYIQNRLHQLDYKTAIGSGEIESAHRYIIQERLKIAGAWWLETNAENMLALRTARANNDWETYWKQAA